MEEESLQGKYFSITDPKEVSTVIYQVNKTEKEFFTIISYDPINSFTLLSASMEYGEDWYTATIQHEAGERNGKRIECRFQLIHLLVMMKTVQ